MNYTNDLIEELKDETTYILETTLVFDYSVPEETAWAEQWSIESAAQKIAEEAAARINELVQPVWYYPEKGELPERIEGWEHSERVLVQYDDSCVAYSIAYYNYNSPFEGQRFVDFNYPKRTVKCWQYITPPVEKEVSGE